MFPWDMMKVVLLVAAAAFAVHKQLPIVDEGFTLKGMHFKCISREWGRDMDSSTLQEKLFKLLGVAAGSRQTTTANRTGENPDDDSDYDNFISVGPPAHQNSTAAADGPADSAVAKSKRRRKSSSGGAARCGNQRGGRVGPATATTTAATATAATATATTTAAAAAAAVAITTKDQAINTSQSHFLQISDDAMTDMYYDAVDIVKEEGGALHVHDEMPAHFVAKSLVCVKHEVGVRWRGRQYQFVKGEVVSFATGISDGKD